MDLSFFCHFDARIQDNGWCWKIADMLNPSGKENRESGCAGLTWPEFVGTPVGELLDVQLNEKYGFVIAPRKWGSGFTGFSRWYAEGFAGSLHS